MDGIKAAWGSQPDLAANELSLRQKIMLLCLMEVKSNASGVICQYVSTF